MSKKIVIVESDSAFSKKLKDELAKNGFNVIETGDGKGAYDLCRKEKPDLVVLAVELSAGQSGYLVCGKLKKDDDLKKTPVIIIGKDPEGFEGHKKLKTRAEEYLKKPFAPEALTVKVGVLIGLPTEKSGEEEVIVDDLSLGALDEVPSPAPAPPAEPQKTIGGDPDLDMLDQAFESMSDAPPGAAPAPAPTPAPEEDALSALSDTSLGVPADVVPVEEPKPELKLGGGDEDTALSALGGTDDHHDVDLGLEIEETSPKVEAAPPRAARPARTSVAAVSVDDAELKSLRAKVTELEEKITQQENQIAEKDSELAAAKATAGGAKDAASLKENLLKKDKEIIKLKSELNEKSKELTEKDTELIDLKEKEAAFESKAGEQAQELAKRDAQLKTFQQKVDQLSTEKKKSDAAITQSKDEARAAAASLATAQGELDQAQDHIGELTREVEELKGKVAQLERDLEAARAETAQAKGAHESEVSSVRAEMDGVKAELEQARNEITGVRSDMEQRQKAAEEEAGQLRGRISELEQTNAKNEDRVVKAYQKIKGDEKLREKTRKAIAVALQLLDENAGANVIDEVDLRP